MLRLLVCVLTLVSLSFSQQYFVQFREQFDSAVPPALPPGWTTSVNRSAAGDFALSLSTPRSSPCAALSSNATISQTITSPLIEFGNCTPARLEFYTSRSSTHTSGLLVEASVDNGLTFPILLGDTIRNPGTTGYMLTSIPLQSLLRNSSNVRFRWRLLGVPGGGTSGTFRLDDVTIFSQLSYDLAITGFTALASGSSLPVQTVTLAAFVKNVGTLPVAEYRVECFQDENHDHLPQAQERISSLTGSFLLPADSVLFTFSPPPIHAGDNHFLALVAFSQDRNASNDTALVTVQGRATPQTLVINEIMYDPATGQNEWIELYHRGTETIDLTRWRISDRPTASGVNSFILSNASLPVRPGSYVVIAADSSILSTADPSALTLILNRPSGFGLNNEGDDVVLRDPLGTTIDSVAYFPSWHHPDISDPKGRSLERINPDLASNDSRNWSTSSSRDGGTPGRQNGIYTVMIPTSASLSLNPNPFSPDGDGFEDFCVIRYNLPLATPTIRISIFDARGRLIRLLANTELGGAHGEVIWNGLDDANQHVRIGPYIIFLEAIDARGGVLSTAKAVVAVATKL